MTGSQSRIQDSISGGPGGASPKKFMDYARQTLKSAGNALIEKLCRVFGQTSWAARRIGWSVPPFPPLGTPLLVQCQCVAILEYDGVNV